MAIFLLAATWERNSGSKQPEILLVILKKGSYRGMIVCVKMVFTSLVAVNICKIKKKNHLSGLHSSISAAWPVTGRCRPVYFD